MIPMPERPSRQVRSAEEFPSTFGQRMGAQFGQAWDDNPVPLFFRWDALSRAGQRGGMLRSDEAKAAAERAGVSLNIPDEGVSHEALDIMIERAKVRQRREDVINRGPQGMLAGAAGFGTEIGAGLLDPIGFGLNFVPVVGQTTRVGMMARSARLGTRIVGRLAEGAIEGAVGQAMVEPAVGYVTTLEGQDYGLGDAAMNIGMGAVMGGVAQNLVGGVGDAWDKWGGKKKNALDLPGTTPVMPEVAAAAAAADPLAASGTIYGANTRVKVGDAYQPARWAVVDAAEVAPTLEKADNQFRDRTRAASDAQVRSIASGIDFEYLHSHPDMSSGAPTLSREGAIIGGNGRTAAVSMAYDLPSRMSYEGPLKERLPEFGINPDAVRGMKKPMLVRVLQQDVDVRAAAIASNETGTLRMSALEQAKVDGERLGKTDLVASDDGRLDTAENRGAIRRWVEQFPESERAALIDKNGALSVEGVSRLRNAALYQAYGDTPVLARLVEATDPGLGRVSAALVRAAGKITEVRGGIARGELHDLDIGDDLVAAVSKLADLRAKGMSVEEFLAQSDMFGMDLSPDGVRLLSFLGRNMDSSRRMADGITRFYDGVERAGDPNQGSMFGPAAPEKSDLLEASLREADEFAGTAEAKMEKVSPATRDAALGVAASQMMDGRDIEVQALVDADPAIGTATADDLLAAADRADRPEAHRTVDMEALAEVEARVAEAPKAWGAETAKAERDRVKADLDLLMDDQENAWRYSRSKTAEDVPESEKLIVMHSTSEEKLLAALDLGGLPVPSLGITKGDAPYSDFGEVSLIGRAGLVDPKKTPVFDADIYSTRAPKVMRDPVKGAAAKLEMEFREASKVYDDRLDLTLGQAVEAGDLEVAKYRLKNSPVSQATFLRSVGVEVDPVIKARQGQGIVGDPEIIAAAKAAYDPNMNRVQADHPEFRGVQSAILAYIEKQDTRKQQDLRDALLNDDGAVSVNKAFRIANDAIQVGKSEVDYYATRDKLSAEIEPRMAEFRKWIDSKLEPAFKEPYILSGRKKLPVTLENVVAVMKRESIKGSENTIAYGPGRVRAEAATRYKSIEQIKADRAKVVSPGVHDAAKKAGDEFLSTYRLRMAETYQIKNYRGKIDTFGAMDASMKLLSDIEKSRGTDADVIAAFKRNDFAEPDAEMIQYARDALDTILENPVQYLEAKPMRAVGVEEFAGAVVPKGASEIRARLEEKGVKVAEYDPNLPDDRARVVASFTRELDAGTGQVRFAREPGSPAVPLTSETVGESVRASFGEATSAILDVGQIKVVDRMDQLPDLGETPPLDMEAVTLPDGRVFVVAENLRPRKNVTLDEHVRGLVLHEVGVHVGLEPMLGRQGFRDVLDQLEALRKSNDPVAIEARSAVPSDTPPYLVEEETLAYLVQHHPEVGFVRKLLADIRAWLYKTFPALREKMKLTTADLQALAVAAVRRVARDAEAARRGAGGDVRYSAEGSALPATLDIDGVARPTLNSAGRPIHPTEEGVRNFWRWFGDSKVVDAEGRPLVVYHGTPNDFSVFKFYEDYGHHFGDISAAKERNNYTGGGNILSVYINATSPLTLDRDPGYWSIDDIRSSSTKIDELILKELERKDLWSIGPKQTSDSTEWERYTDVDEYMDDMKAKGGISKQEFYTLLHDAMVADGYDSIGYPNAIEGGFSYAVRDSTQIKSATGNTGAFSDATGDIRYSRGRTPVPPRDALQAFADAEVKAGKYAAAVKAAATRIGDDAAMRAAIEKAGGGELVGREVDELIDLLKARHNEIVRGLRKARDVAGAGDAAINLQDAALRAAAEIADQQERAAAVEHRNAMLSLAAKTKGVSYVLSQFEGREAEGVMALLAGSKHLRQGARMSCELEQKSILGKWMGGMEGAMRKAGVWEHWRRDAYPRDVARALWQLSQDAPDMTGIHSDAVKIAEIVHKFQLDAKIQQNRAGAWIGDLKGWMFRQGHDGDKMSRAGFEKWREFVESRLDWPRVLEGMGVEDVARFDRNAFLKRTFDDLRMGNHKRVQPIEVIAPSVGPGNLAKKVSQSRVLHFRDADAGFEYLQAFGPGDGSLVETVMGGFDAASRNVGLMRVLGPNYEGNLIQMMDHIEDAMLGASDKARKKFKQKRKEILDLLHHVDGSLSIPHSQLGAKIWGGLRAQQMTSKLGAALLAQFSDIPTYAANIAHRFDTSLGAGINDAISGLLQGRAKGERLEVLHECAYFFESASHQALARFDMADMTGMMSKLTEMFFKWGGMTWWSEVLRSSAVLTIARRMGEARTKGWDALPNDTREMLGLYKIDAGKWDLMRMASTKEADGQIYLTPEGFHTVSDAALEQYLTAAGRPVTPATVAALRENLADTYRSLIIDQSEFSVLEPGARQRQFMYRGTQRGTVAGDMLRTFYQFKSFPITYLDRVLGREIYGRGYDSFGDYLRNGKMSHFAAFAGFAAALTLCGLFSLQSKQLIKLREMRPLDDARTWAAAFMQGGAIGLYGDFLFGSYNRMGQGMLESLAGPVPSAILGRGGAVPLLYEGAFGVSAPLLGEEDEFEPKDLAAKWLRWGQSNTPFINLHVLRPTLDALIFWRLQEALNPGSMRRMERNLMKESGTRYLVRPSEVVQ